MPDAKISALTAATSAATTDVVPIVDSGGTFNKKLSVTNFTKSLDISGQTAETVLDDANDMVLLYDASEPGINKMSVANLTQNKATKTNTISGAGGITGGGDLSANRTLTMDITSLAAETSVDTANDLVLLYDASESANNKMTVANLTINKASTATTISGAGGITGGGDLSANRTLTLDVTSLAAETSVDETNDLVLLYDQSEGANNKMTVGNLVANRVPNTRTVSAGSGLTGGGDLSANRTLSVDISGQTELAETAAYNDYVQVYDTSASSIKKISVDNFVAPNYLHSYFFEDFIWDSVATTNGIVKTTGGTAAAVIQFTGATPSRVDHPGILRIAPGTTSTGLSAINWGITTMVFGGNTAYYWEWNVYIETLASVGDDYILRCGVGDSLSTTSSTESSNGVYFRYNRSVSTNWVIETGKASTYTTTTTGTAVAAATWYRLRVEVTSGLTATFYINGSSVGTSSTNIPNTAANVCGPLLRINKTAGTTGLFFYADYFLYKSISSARA